MTIHSSLPPTYSDDVAFTFEVTKRMISPEALVNHDLILITLNGPFDFMAKWGGNVSFATQYYRDGTNIYSQGISRGQADSVYAAFNEVIPERSELTTLGKATRIQELIRETFNALKAGNPNTPEQALLLRFTDVLLYKLDPKRYPLANAEGAVAASS